VWGANKNGQLGLGHKTADVSIPTPFTLLQTASDDGRSDPVLNSNLVRSLHLGSTFSAAVDTNGNLFTFGYGGSAFGGMVCLQNR
jgi:alpha-tubulin suppressor-like RCC1 family protein